MVWPSLISTVGLHADPARGDIYFGSSYGLVTLHPDSVRFDMNPPQVYITDFQIVQYLSTSR